MDIRINFMQNTTNTLRQYNDAIEGCREIFLKKNRDYGSSWRVLRTISIVDQIFIKAKRIRTVQEKRDQKIGDAIASEFRGIINYAVIGLIQLQLGTEEVEDLPGKKLEALYDAEVEKARTLMKDKNHDYGEAWRDMSQESFTDLILSKLLRIKQILSNEGRTLISEGIESNYFDILNYAVFALILIEEGVHEGSEKAGGRS
jgi:hypothetical protein